MASPAIWLIGDHEHAEFAAAVWWLEAHADVVRFASPTKSLLEASRDLAPPTAVVFAVARPGRFTAADIEQLHRREPLTPLVALVGSLCEGEVRSGSPWPGVTRIYFHQWQSRLPRALGLETSSGNASWSPRTASAVDADEQLSLASVHPSDALIGIFTANRATFETLADACAAAGYRCDWLPPRLPLGAKNADVILTDDDRNDSHDSNINGVPRVLLLNFPRRGDIEHALAAGAAAVVAKPFQLIDLWSAIELALQSRQAPTTRIPP